MSAASEAHWQAYLQLLHQAASHRLDAVLLHPSSISATAQSLAAEGRRLLCSHTSSEGCEAATIRLIRANLLCALLKASNASAASILAASLRPDLNRAIACARAFSDAQHRARAQTRMLEEALGAPRAEPAPAAGASAAPLTAPPPPAGASASGSSWAFWS